MFKIKRRIRTHDGNQVIFPGGIFRDESQPQAFGSNVLSLTLGQGLLERLGHGLTLGGGNGILKDGNVWMV